QAQDSYNASGAIPYFLRPVDQITAFFDGLELLEPGVVSVPFWRPEPGAPAAQPIGEHGGLARKA
ncbi:SAM-dependent methyltransferase, partial [Streptomyces sp. NPDC052114]